MMMTKTKKTVSFAPHSMQLAFLETVEEEAVPVQTEAAVPVQTEAAKPMQTEAAKPMQTEGAKPMQTEAAIPVEEEEMQKDALEEGETTIETKTIDGCANACIITAIIQMLQSSETNPRWTRERVCNHYKTQDTYKVLAMLRRIYRYYQRKGNFTFTMGMKCFQGQRWLPALRFWIKAVALDLHEAVVDTRTECSLEAFV